MSTRMGRRVSIAMIRIVAISALAAFLPVAFPAAAAAQCGTPPNAPCSGTFQTTFYDTEEVPSENGTGAGDNIIRLVNPVGCANGGVSNAICPSETNLCAMIYVFDQFEELGECCGCPVTPQGLISLSVEKNLIANWGLARALNNSGVVDIISAAPNYPANQQPKCSGVNGCNGGCDPMMSYTPTPELKGYILHNNVIDSRLTYKSKPVLTLGLTEVPLADAGDADSKTLNYLVNECAALIGNNTPPNGFCTCVPPPAAGTKQKRHSPSPNK